MLDKTTIANQATIARKQLTVLISRITNRAQSTSNFWRIYDPESDTWTYTILEPSTPGQILTNISGSDLAAMYVAVPAGPSGYPEWVPVKVASSAINPETGKTWDPLQNF